MTEELRRWRLVLGGGDADGTGTDLEGLDARRDATLEALYRAGGSSASRNGGLGASSPRVARWLGDIRTYFPTSVVQVMQRDAIERLGLHRLLLEPEMLDAIQPDVHLLGTLLALRSSIPTASRDAERAVIRKVTDDLERRLATKTASAVTGALHRSARQRRPRLHDIDWNRTIAANLRRYQPEYRTVIPEVLVGYGRKTSQVQRDLILAIDQSGSMASSVVYASVFGSVLASVRALRTRLVVFDTEVVDLTDDLADPVEVLFGVQLGGGTDINRAVAYCEQHVRTPRDTILLLITDLHEGGDTEEMLRRLAGLHLAGVRVIVLLALSDDGAPSFDHDSSAALAEVGIPVFACTPDQFPDVMAAAIDGRPVMPPSA